MVIIIILVSIIGFLLFERLRPVAVTETVVETETDTRAKTGTRCNFSGRDIFNGRVYTAGGEPVVKQPIMDCSECEDYYYKSNGECVGYTYDKVFTGLCLAKKSINGACPF